MKLLFCISVAMAMAPFATASTVVAIRFCSVRTVGGVGTGEYTLCVDYYYKGPYAFNETRTPLHEAIEKVFEETAKVEAYWRSKPQLKKIEIEDEVATLYLSMTDSDVAMRRALRACMKITIERMLPYAAQGRFHVPSVKGFRFVFVEGGLPYPESGYFPVAADHPVEAIGSPRLTGEGQPRVPHHPACGSAPGGSDQTAATALRRSP